MTTTHIIQLATALVLCIILAFGVLAYRSAQRAHVKGYDLGYDDAKRGHDLRVAVLEEEIGRLRRAAVNQSAAHRLDRDAIMQDADRRVATYASRSWNANDLTLLRRTAKQLLVAARTYSEFTLANLSDQARFALEVAGQVEQLVLRIEQQLAGDLPEPTANADAVMAAAAIAEHITNGKSWLVYGPQACGKTRNAPAIAAALGLAEIVDDWQPGEPVPITKALVLTNHDGPHQPFTRRVLTFDQAMSLVAAKAKQEAAA
ncbi:hypothetical protein [Pseudomonas sp. LRF_L74]|uniref:hypothetical protein n=1 Tax=Pseudomonas sp. LRF_L74 TaxID=3369422 RepID=UPI003F5DF001